MIFLGTSYLLALVVASDGLHARAMAWGAVLAGPFITTDYVLCEFVNSLSTPGRRHRAHDLLSGLRASSAIRVVFVDPDLFEAGIRMHAARPDKAWSLTDCISFELMSRQGIRQALTHDHHFEQAGYEALLRKDPVTP